MAQSIKLRISERFWNLNGKWVKGQVEIFVFVHFKVRQVRRFNDRKVVSTKLEYAHFEGSAPVPVSYPFSR